MTMMTQELAVETARTEPLPPPRLVVREVVKEFRRHGGDLVNAVDNVSVEVRPGELLVLLGPSGCGKSTLLRCIAGLEVPTSGTIEINGEAAFDAATGIVKAPNERDVNMMFQSYALWPHMNLEDNVAYPLRSAGVRKAVARARAKEYLELVGLQGLAEQHPGMISGGQQQRVSLARTLISEPSIVLFDEPLSNVDARIRVKLRALLDRLHRQLDFAAVYVTHDQVEAMGLGTRIAVMRNGRVDQLAPPTTVYEHPSSRSTAEFIGEANFFEAVVGEERGDLVTVRIEGRQCRIPRTAWSERALPAAGAAVTLMVRPEKFRIVPADSGETADLSWPGSVSTSTFSGAYTEYHCRVGEVAVDIWRLGTPDERIRDGSDVLVQASADAIRVVSDD